jgi:hypothetical protein
MKVPSEGGEQSVPSTTQPQDLALIGDVPGWFFRAIRSDIGFSAKLLFRITVSAAFIPIAVIHVENLQAA